MWTETEAKTKWCPMVRVVTADGVCNRHPDSVAPMNCVASACMMWRKHDQIGIGPNGEKRDRDMDGRTRWVDRGYCGLAGQQPSALRGEK